MSETEQTENFYNPFPFGKWVFDLELNEGQVIAIDEVDMYPVKVIFRSGERESYDFDGKRYINGNQMLFTSKMKVIKSE